jgi:hypothetical protein
MVRRNGRARPDGTVKSDYRDAARHNVARHQRSQAPGGVMSI